MAMSRTTQKIGKCRHCRKPGCRRGRPLCRKMREVKPQQNKCECSGGCAWPHRRASIGLCIHHPNHAELAWSELDKPIRKSA